MDPMLGTRCRNALLGLAVAALALTAALTRAGEALKPGKLSKEEQVALQPGLLFSRGDEPALVRGMQRRDGRMLFATRGCAQCHELPGNVKDAAMPELKQRGPSLEGAGRRLRAAWMAHWIRAPRALRPE